MKSALLVVDMQNAFCRPTGSFVRRGLAIEGIDRVVERCRALVALAAQRGWLVVRKTRYDPFCGTALETALRRGGVGDLVVCGVTTNVCVESTVRHAHDLDFPVRVVEDAVASYDRALHAASLATMARHFATRVTVADLEADRGPGAA